MKTFKRILCILLIFLLAVLLCGAAVFGFYVPQYLCCRDKLDISAMPESDRITVVSSNVRCFAPGDLFKKSWFFRAPLLLKTLQNAAPDIIGFQEVTPMHRRFLDRVLFGYGCVLQYRDNTPLRESCPIYYNESRFELKDKGSFWLSETPDEMSKGWGAACYRICSYVILSQKSDGKQFVVFNTHLDHVSEEARINGIRLVLQKIEQFGGMPSVIMGDLNATEGTQTYEAATALFLDAKYQTNDSDTGATYQCFGEKLQAENIDYFLVSKNGIEVLQYKILRDTYDGVYPSDHFPIRLEMKLR